MTAMKAGALALVVVLWGSLAQAGTDLAGRVVRVLDGDTVVLLDRGMAQHKIRLAGIDAPETGQEFGTRAKQHLDLVGGNEITVAWQKRDKYGRIVGKLVYDGIDVNLAMVRSGFAWWYRTYAGEQSSVDRLQYAAAQERAQTEKIGLWTDKAPLAPWEWRHQPAPTPVAADCSCGTGAVCIGPKGGRYCVREGGGRRYYPKG
jgi:micrococcal nuclease